MTELELLAPARDINTAKVAIDYGADAVYIGAGHHGARAAATNSIDDIRELCLYAHRFRAKVYVTLNTLVYDDEIEQVRQLVIELYQAGVDALIVQDMALLEMDLPPIELHASTQCDTRTVEKARFLQDVGFSQIVLPREFTLEQIRAVREATTVPLEGFVHGALCVSYSGDCRASLVNGGRSANRGQCAQICRLPYNLVDGNGNVVIADRHLLSLRDMNRLAHLSEMAEAGISSFKIEGRLKSADYVRNVVSAYSSALNDIVRAFPGRYCRASYGQARPSFSPDVAKAFNRGFTNYFLTNAMPAPASMASMLTPKHVGSPVGKVVQAGRRQLKLRTDAAINNGDGLGFFDRSGKFVGFRVNRAEAGILHLNIDLPALPEKGTTLYRNMDKAFADILDADRTRRTLAVAMTLDTTTRGIALTVTDERGCRATSTMELEHTQARSPQLDTRSRTLQRTGDTIYRLDHITDNLGDLFIPASSLTELRRQALSALDSAAASTRPLPMRRKTAATATFPKTRLDMHDNVANRLAAAFYARHGATVIQPALETNMTDTNDRDIHVMTTRYCLRRELGKCLRTEAGIELKGPLTLVSTDGRTRPMRIEFDCANCQMKIFACAQKNS